jgi:hypothetical protein
MCCFICSVKELEQGKIVWAKYGKLMWPARVEKLIRTGKTNVIQKVSVRYFEANQKMSYVFKLEPSKIELFFRSVEKHYINKVGFFYSTRQFSTVFF